MAQRKKSGGRRYGKAAGKTVASAMRRRKRGTLKSGKRGKGGTVKSRKQAIAIGLSEARREGKRVPAGPVGRPSKAARSRAAKKSHARERAAPQHHKSSTRTSIVRSLRHAVRDVSEHLSGMSPDETLV